MRILRISTTDIGGGAERVSYELFTAAAARGYVSKLAVGQKRGQDSDVFAFGDQERRSLWAAFVRAADFGLSRLPSAVPGVNTARHWLPLLERPGGFVSYLRGHEDFAFPGTWKLLDYAATNADIVHCHNLHGGYFDLRALPALSRMVPVVITASDGWLLSGHCAHSFDCDRWMYGCGNCPDLSIPLAVRRDATAHNWKRKRDILRESRLYVATSSHWLMERVQRSMLWPSVIESRVIPNGIDLTLFHPGARETARENVDIPHDTKMLLFAANGIRKNPFKDYRTLRAALSLVEERIADDERVVFVALGDAPRSERIGRIEVRFIPYERDRAKVAQYFQAADLYLHAARAEVWGLTITEALACGTPVIATAVGGIPEQVKGLCIPDIPSESCGPNPNEYDPSEATGVLVHAGDVNGFADSILHLLNDESLRRRLAANAANDARLRFDVNRYVSDYFGWYEDILQPRKGDISRQLALVDNERSMPEEKTNACTYHRS